MEQKLGQVRHILTLLAGYLITQGVTDESTAEASIGIIVFLVSAIWSWKSKGEKVALTEKLSGQIRHILTAVAGVAVQRGWLNSESVPYVVGLIVYLIGGGWSWISKGGDDE